MPVTAGFTRIVCGEEMSMFLGVGVAAVADGVGGVLPGEGAAVEVAARLYRPTQVLNGTLKENDFCAGPVTWLSLISWHGGFWSDADRVTSITSVADITVCVVSWTVSPGRTSSGCMAWLWASTTEGEISTRNKQYVRMASSHFLPSRT